MHPADARGQVRCARAAPMRSHLDMAFRRGEVCVTHEAYSAADTLQLLDAIQLVDRTCDAPPIPAVSHTHRFP